MPTKLIPTRWLVTAQIIPAGMRVGMRLGNERDVGGKTVEKGEKLKRKGIKKGRAESPKTNLSPSRLSTGALL